MTTPPLVRAPRCTFRTDSHCVDPDTCLGMMRCVERVKVHQQLAGAKRKPPAGYPLRSARR